MKKKSLLVIGLIVVAGVASGLYFGTAKKAPVVQPLEQESPMAMDGESASDRNVVLDDTSTKIQQAREEEKEASREKANGTGEMATFETPEDLLYEQQLSEENDRPMLEEAVITMYVTSDCRVRSLPSTDGNVLANLKKGDKVKVTKIGDWNTVELDDGKEGYVRGDLLTQDKNPGESVPEAGNQGESASKNNGNGGNNGGNGGNSQSAPQPTPAPEQPTQGESASTQPAPAPEPQPQPAPAPEQPQGNSDVANPNLTPEEMDRIAAELGFTFGDVTGEVRQSHVDPNAAENSGVDLSGVTLH